MTDPEVRSGLRYLAAGAVVALVFGALSAAYPNQDAASALLGGIALIGLLVALVGVLWTVRGWRRQRAR